MAGPAESSGEIAALSEERGATARRALLSVLVVAAGLSVAAFFALGGYSTAITPISAGLYIAGGAIDAWRRPTNSGGWILLAAGWLIGIGPLTRIGIPSIAIPMVALANAPEILATAALLTFPQGRFISRVDLAVWAATLGGFLIDATAILLLSDPRNSSTPWQPFRLPVEQVGSDIYASLYPLTLAGAFVIGLVVAWRVVVRWRDAASPTQHVLQPVVAAALIGIALYGVGYLIGLIAGASGGPLSATAFLIARLSAVLLPAAFLVAVLRLRSDRAAVVDLVELLGQSPTPAALSLRVRGVLHDPTARLLSWSEERGGWLDDTGLEIDASTLQGHALTRIEDQGRLVAAIEHDRSLEGADAILTPLRVALALALRPASAVPANAVPARGPGDPVGPYRLERELGRGGMGIVYLARDPTLDRPVALKVLHPAVAADPQVRRRFIREARTVAVLEHPNIVPVYGAGGADQLLLWMASRWVDGEDLGSLMRSTGRLPIERTLTIVGAVASALDFAAGRGFVHRDVKPSNILLATAGEVYLADFGLTRALDDGGTSAATETGAFVGTVDFVAPEQIRGERVGPEADVYSLACVTYASLIGEPPFRRATPLATMWAHLHDEPRLASDVRADVPAALGEVVARGLAKEPRDRPPSAGSFASAAREAMGATDP